MMFKELKIFLSTIWDQSNNRGQILIEVIIALAIFSLVGLTVTSLVTGSLAALIRGGDQTEAQSISQEAIEAVRSIRDRAFNELNSTSTGVSIAGNNDGPATWWDTAYHYRRRITVTTGANSPSGGYNGYSVRFSDFDTEDLVTNSKMKNNCDDLRIIYWNGSSNVELSRHVISCNSTTTDIRFSLQSDISASSSDGSYYLYYGASKAPIAPATMTDVYLFYDDVSSDSSSSYSFGSCGDGNYSAWSYNSSGYFEISSNDNHGGCFRNAINERDAYIEAEWYHTGCQPINMISGMVGRYTGTGSGSSESPSQYYRSTRKHNSSCGGGYSGDGDIVKLGGTAVDGTDESTIIEDQWRKQALSLWGINGTRASFWNNDTVSGFGPMGWPSIAPTASSTDETDQESAGDWGVWAHQDISRVRNILIRRYVNPEPVLSLADETGPNQWVLKGQGTTDSIGKFTRLVTLSNVCRDSSDDIATCPGSYTDIHSLLVTASTTWSPRSGIINEVIQSSYITNWDSREWTQTDWDGGANQTIWSVNNQYASSTDVDVSTDGQISLATGATTCPSNTWSFDNSSNYVFDSNKIEVASSTARLVGSGNPVSYPTDRPDVYPNNSFIPSTVDAWISFTETATKPSGTEIYYQLSSDGGSNWQYWDGSSWVNASSTTDYNTASVVDSNIWELSPTSSGIRFKAFLESSGSAQVQLSSVEIDCRNLQYEIGQTSTDENWVTVSFNNTYEEPVIFTIYEESSNTLPASPRVRNLSATSTDLRIQHPTDSNLSSDTIRYWVIEEGNWTIDDVQLEVHTFDTNTVGHNVNGNGQDWVGDTITYDQTYDAAPLVFHQVQTNNDSEWIVTWASSNGDRTNPPGLTNAQVALNGAEAYSSHGTETVGWMAIEAGVTGSIGSNSFETFRIPDNAGNVGGHDDGCNTTTYQLTYQSAPAAFAYTQEFDGGNGGWTVICSASDTTQIGFHLEEDQVLDSERGHYSEITGYIAFDGNITNSADTSYVSPGILISSAFDATDDSPVQVIEWDEMIPSCTPACDVRIQIQTAQDDDGSPGDWTPTWSGPDGDDGDETDFYTDSSGEIIHPDHNGDQWIRYKATLRGAGDNTPILSEVRVNYK